MAQDRFREAVHNRQRKYQKQPRFQSFKRLGLSASALVIAGLLTYKAAPVIKDYLATAPAGVEEVNHIATGDRVITRNAVPAEAVVQETVLTKLQDRLEPSAEALPEQTRPWWEPRKVKTISIRPERQSALTAEPATEVVQHRVEPSSLRIPLPPVRKKVELPAEIAPQSFTETYRDAVRAGVRSPILQRLDEERPAIVPEAAPEIAVEACEVRKLVTAYPVSTAEVNRRLRLSAPEMRKLNLTRTSVLAQYKGCDITVESYLADINGGRLPPVEYFEYFKRGLAKYGFDRLPIRHASRDVRITISAESGGWPMAVSRTQAMGITQFMPGTARDHDLDDPFDPAANTAASQTYITWLKSKFGDNWRLAYNWGPGNFSDHLRRNGGRVNACTLPAETRNYARLTCSRNFTARAAGTGLLRFFGLQTEERPARRVTNFRANRHVPRMR